MRTQEIGVLPDRASAGEGARRGLGGKEEVFGAAHGTPLQGRRSRSCCSRLCRCTSGYSKGHTSSRCGSGHLCTRLCGRRT